MKPSAFEYHRPTQVHEALDLLTEHGEDAKLLAGGQSLVPLLNFRLAAPPRLIDCNRLGELDYIRREHGSLRIGALTRQAVLERSPLVQRHWPVLHEAVSWVAHPQIRNRGTVGGSVAHADPAAELPVVFAALDARFHVRSKGAQRVVDAKDFFITHLTTELEPHEMLTEIEVPGLPDGCGWAFEEFSRRHGDFALGGAAVVLAAREDGSCREARIALLAAADTPVRASAAEQLLIGSQLDQATAAEAARTATASIEPTGDIHGDSAYRRQLIEALVQRALLNAAARAVAGNGSQPQGGER
jgi:carbon-monoxide dehydrogenase medium subunit/6-hydroxypseudooxynicotine dehydrogenase subunit alpha